jgi:hypothetical protein
MKIEEIEEAWKVDAVIPLDLEEASRSISTLHAKYWKIMMAESAVAIIKEGELKKLKVKYLDFLRNPTKEGRELGFTVRDTRIIPKSDFEALMEGEPKIVELEGNLKYQREKIKMLESIIRELHSRRFDIKNSIDFMKFQAGER